MADHFFNNFVKSSSIAHYDELGADKHARQEASRQAVQSGTVHQEALFFFPKETIRGVQFQYKE